MSFATQGNVCFLLVDDRKENLIALEALLRRDGLNLLQAQNGQEALELLLTNDVALALLDVQMPDMDGFELAELMRSTEKTRRIPIIFVTAGSSDAKRRFRGYEAGAVDFIQKPIEPDILKSKAEVFFELGRQREENLRLLAATQQNAAALLEADRKKDEFLATLAHELRNPLAPIRNGLQVLSKDPLPEIAEETRQIMNRQVTHMVHLIDDLLDVSRINLGKIDLRKKTITLQEAVKMAIEATKPAFAAAKHRFTHDVPETPLWVEADITRLSQIIGNLLSNAAKYTPNRGKIALSVARNDDNVIVTISDNGTGISEEMLPKIFDLFTQASHNKSHSQGGLGIGLALVKNLVDMHDGQITGNSAGHDQGSTFTLSLPLKSPPSQMENDRLANQVQNQKAYKILVIDDNIASMKTTGWMLEALGHEAISGSTGQEALTLARIHKPDIILLDIGLPDTSGYEVCQTLRLDPAFATTVIIAQTGWGQEKDRELAKQAGFDHHLIKPVDLGMLSEIIQNNERIVST